MTAAPFCDLFSLIFAVYPATPGCPSQSSLPLPNRPQFAGPDHFVPDCCVMLVHNYVNHLTSLEARRSANSQALLGHVENDAWNPLNEFSSLHKQAGALFCLSALPTSSLWNRRGGHSVTPRLTAG